MILYNRLSQNKPNRLLMNYSSVLILCGALVLSACSSNHHNPNGGRHIARKPMYKPSTIENACAIMGAHPTWRNAFIGAHKKYGAPPHVVMAILYQESRFVHNARPSRGNAYGYAQALDATWDWYKSKSGHKRAARDHLPDAVDFVGWYLQQNKDRTGVSKWDARNQYLAYHEGTGGYLNDSHNEKAWLLKVADKVNRHAIVYRQQLADCYKY